MRMIWVRIKMMIRILLSSGTIFNLGRIVLALSCNSFIAIQRENLAQSMELVTSNIFLLFLFSNNLFLFFLTFFIFLFFQVTGNYSSDLRNLIMYLLTAPQRVKSVNDLMPMIGELIAHLDDLCISSALCLCLELNPIE